MGSVLESFCVLLLCVILIPICAGGVQLGIEGVSWTLLRLANAVMFLTKTTTSTMRCIGAAAPPQLHQAWKAIKRIFEFIIGASALLVAIVIGAGLLYLLLRLLTAIFENLGAVLEFLPFLLP